MVPSRANVRFDEAAGGIINLSQSLLWAGNVDLAGGASGKIMQRRRMSGSCPEFKDFKPASAPTAARSGL